MRRHRQGFSIIEAVMSMAIVGGLLVVAINTVGASVSAQQSTGNHGRGRLLTAAMLSEILQLGYHDPGASVTFGLEALEAGTTRAAFDDVDDYHALSETTLKEKDGTVLPGLTGWRRSVTVALMDPTSSGTVAGSDLGVKRVTVQVWYQDVLAAELSALKWGQPPPATPAPTPGPAPNPGPGPIQTQTLKQSNF